MRNRRNSDEEDHGSQPISQSGTSRFVLKAEESAQQKKQKDESSRLAIAPGNAEDEERPSWREGSDEPEDSKPALTLAPGCDAEFASEVARDNASADGTTTVSQMDGTVVAEKVDASDEDVRRRIKEEKLAEMQDRIEQEYERRRKEREAAEVQVVPSTNKKILIWASVGFVVAVIAVVVAITVGGNSNEPSQPVPSPQPSLSPSMSLQPSLSYRPSSEPSKTPSFEPSMVPTTVEFNTLRSALQGYFNDTTFPVSDAQKEALSWLENEDGLSASLQSDPDQLLDRFLAVVIYFATRGSTWIESANWLSDTPTCDWEGLTCDVNGRIESMELGMRLIFLPYFVVSVVSHVAVHVSNYDASRKR